MKRVLIILLALSLYSCDETFKEVPNKQLKHRRVQQLEALGDTCIVYMYQDNAALMRYSNSDEYYEIRDRDHSNTGLIFMFVLGIMVGFTFILTLIEFNLL